ncbi:radical SAM protein [Chloroflexota bacterium]
MLPDRRRDWDCLMSESQIIATNPSNIITPKLQLVAWELTRNCNLFCAHCRGTAARGDYEGELTTKECFKVIDQILAVGNPILILTGGEPLMRPDVYEIGQYASGKGMRVVMGTNGTLITQEVAEKLKAIPVARVGISLDFPKSALQDEFRGQEGAYAAAVEGISHARVAGIDVQINSTITKLNVEMLDDLIALALELGAVAFHPFLLVPTGRGKNLEDLELAPEKYEETLNKIYDKQKELGERLFFKPTDVPHYMRIRSQRQKQEKSSGVASGYGGGGHPTNALTRGCLAGTGFAFISHLGKVKGCGYLDIEAGDLRKQNFVDIWADSPLFCSLRDISSLKGKCGRCEYKRICGGCRARAYETNGDCLGEEPYCIYQPETGVKHDG